MPQTNDSQNSWKSLAQIKSEVLKKIAKADGSKAKKGTRFFDVNSKELKSLKFSITQAE
jgi:hypothetical protein